MRLFLKIKPHSAMNTPHTTHRPSLRGFISAKLAIVLSVIAVSCGVLAYEWHQADTSKVHHISASAHHHHKKHGHKTVATG
jgi:hypothetical protein